MLSIWNSRVNLNDVFLLFVSFWIKIVVLIWIKQQQQQKLYGSSKTKILNKKKSIFTHTNTGNEPNDDDRIIKNFAWKNFYGPSLYGPFFLGITFIAFFHFILTYHFLTFHFFISFWCVYMNEDHHYLFFVLFTCKKIIIKFQ